MRPDQPDLFASGSDGSAAAPLDPELLAHRREALLLLLAEARDAARMPWTPTEAILAELRFDSLSSSLPEAEREALRVEFGVELDRLFATVSGSRDGAFIPA